MHFFLLGVLILAVGLFALRALADADVEKVAKYVRRFGAVLLILLGVFLALVGRWVFALPLFAMAFALIRRQLPGFSGFGGGARSQGQTSRVQSKYLDMQLNHDTGDMDGKILTGRLAGRRLSSLSLGELMDFTNDVADDEESRSLMDAYLDRRFPGWREDQGTGPEQKEARPGKGRKGPMTRKEALAILGLEEGATAAQIRSAHRRLMKQLHPDQGGSTYFASKLNEARDLLLP